MVASVFKYMKFIKGFLKFNFKTIKRNFILSYNVNQDLNRLCSNKSKKVKRKLPKLTQNKFNFPIRNMKLFLNENLTSNIISI